MCMTETELLGIESRHSAVPGSKPKLSTWSVRQASSSLRKSWTEPVMVIGISRCFTERSEGDG